MTAVCQRHQLVPQYFGNCNNCKHAIPLSNSHYCTKLKKHMKGFEDCPYFEPEPTEYKIYIRM